MGRPSHNPSRGVSCLDDIVAMESVPITAGDWPESSYELIRRASQKYGDRPALTYLPDATALSNIVTYSFRELLGTVHQTANLFRALGVGKDDVVAYALPNVPQAHFALWGGEAAGVAFAINALLAPTQIATLLSAAEAKIFVTTEAIWVEIARHLETLPLLHTALVVDGDGRSTSSKRVVLNFDKAIAEHPRLALDSERHVLSSDRSSLFCTGGTTGVPKIAMRTHGGEVANAKMVQTIFNNPTGKPQIFFCGLPLHHVNASMNTGLVPWFYGHHVVLGTPTGYRNQAVIDRFWEIVETFRIGAISTVPTVLGSLLRSPVGTRDIGSLERVVCGAAPMPTALFRRFEQTTGLSILEGYGLTESMCVSSCNPVDGERRIGSIGLRMPWQQMRSVKLDANGKYVHDCALDEVGAIAICGPNVFEGYKNDDHNRGIWLDIADGERWFNTGDLGRMDRDGYFWLTGRSKELIIRGGHNIDPALIEEPMHRHPAVEIAAAVPRPDSHAGEVPVVYVQLRKDASASEEELLSYAAEAIPERAAVPKRVHLIPIIPLTVVGKIFKPALVAQEIAEVVRSEAASTGTTLTSVNVRQDSRIGWVAEVVVEGDTSSLRQSLERYSFGLEWR
jgi:fatty-acyl-CoA synthase